MSLRIRARMRGFTLIELMISMAIGLAILLALITMLVSVSRNNSELSYSNRLVENGRFAMQLLDTDLEHAGYLGGYVPDFDDLTTTGTPKAASTAGGTVPTAVPDPCLVYSAANWTDEYKANLLGITTAGSNVTAAGAKPFCSGVLATPRPSNDVLVVRHAEPCVAGSGTNECSDTIASANPDVYLQASRCTSDAKPFVLSAASADLTLRKRDCTAANPAERRRFASTLYYIKDDGDVPTLMRSQLFASGGAPTHQAAQALVENVQAFRVEYGVDLKSDSNESVVLTDPINWANASVKVSPRNRGDGTPESFVRCTQAVPCTAATMTNVVAVKLYVLVRAEKPTAGYTDGKTYKLGSADTACADAAEADSSAACAPTVGPFNDGYRRHLFTQTVRLINVSGRRETPP